MQIFGLSKGVSVSAVSAGILDVSCDVVPVVLCGEVDEFGNPLPNGGYSDGELAILKLAAGDDKDLGPGNFRLLQLPKGNGPPNVMRHLAGSFPGCPDEFRTKAGNNVGPVITGINSRFYDPTKPPLAKDEDLYQADHFDHEGPFPHFPGDAEPALSYDNETETIFWDDGVTEHALAPLCEDNTVGNFDQFCVDGLDSNYRAAYAADHDPEWVLDDGRFERRIIGVPIASCEGDTGGSVPAEPFGLGCFFLMQPAIQKGTEAHIFGEFIEECSAFPFPEEDAEIVLYKDPAKVDS